MHAFCGRCDALGRMNSRGASDDYQIQRSMRQEEAQVRAGADCIFGGERIHSIRICADYGFGAKLRNSQCCADVSICNVAAADESYVQHSPMRSLQPFAILLSCPPNSGGSILPECRLLASEFRGSLRTCSPV